MIILKTSGSVSLGGFLFNGGVIIFLVERFGCLKFTENNKVARSINSEAVLNKIITKILNE